MNITYSSFCGSLSNVGAKFLYYHIFPNCTVEADFVGFIIDKVYYLFYIENDELNASV